MVTWKKSELTTSVIRVYHSVTHTHTLSISLSLTHTHTNTNTNPYILYSVKPITKLADYLLTLLFVNVIIILIAVQF